MINPELYKVVKAISVPGFTFRELQGENALNSSVPFKDEHAAYSLVSVNSNLGKGVAGLSTELIQISPYHQRSFQLKIAGQRSVYFSDEFNNLYSSLTLKGNNLEEVKIGVGAATPTGIIFWGLQDSFAMIRILRASQLLRQNNIPTEIITRIVEPNVLPYEDSMVTLEEFKAKLLKRAWDKSETPEEGVPSKEDVLKVAKVLEETTFLITTRGMQVPERVEDLRYTLKEKQDFLEMMGGIFEFVNFRDKENFNTENQEEIDRYFGEYFPKELAKNYGRLHNLGLVHKYPHPGNISLTGSIYDLDSVRGRPLMLGDKKISDLDIKNDLSWFLYSEKAGDGIIIVLNQLKKAGFISEEATINFAVNFFETYLRVRQVNTGSIHDLLKMTLYFGGDGGVFHQGFHEIVNRYLSRLISVPIIEHEKAEHFVEVVIGGSVRQPFHYFNELEGLINADESLDLEVLKFTLVDYLWENVRNLIAETIVMSTSEAEKKKIIIALTSEVKSKVFIKKNEQAIYLLGVDFICWSIEKQIDFEKFKERALKSVEKYLEEADFNQIKARATLPSKVPV